VPEFQARGEEKTLKTSLFDLAGHVAVVIGGTTGIGRAMVLGLADAGASVVASSRRKEQMDEVASEIEAKGVKTLRIASHVCDRASLQQLRDSTLGELCKVDILINCAGMTKRAPTLDFPEYTWDIIIETNRLSPARLSPVTAAFLQAE
jgi:NAD(P)-dependent dehydrogenase (short-subunit alcohol dehydrogenase family)